MLEEQNIEKLKAVNDKFKPKKLQKVKVESDADNDGTEGQESDSENDYVTYVTLQTLLSKTHEISMEELFENYTSLAVPLRTNDEFTAIANKSIQKARQLYIALAKSNSLKQGKGKHNAHNLTRFLCII